MRSFSKDDGDARRLVDEARVVLSELSNAALMQGLVDHLMHDEAKDNVRLGPFNLIARLSLQPVELDFLVDDAAARLVEVDAVRADAIGPEVTSYPVVANRWGWPPKGPPLTLVQIALNSTLSRAGTNLT